MAISLGIDVGGVRKGFHVVALSTDRLPLGSPQRISTAAGLGELIASVQPDVIAIDAPCGWSVAKSRLAERRLARRGIASFYTPTRERARRTPSFYGWMFQGEAAFAAALASHPLYAGEGTVAGCAMEVFPHATAHVLTGGRKPDDRSKVSWRRELLRRMRIDDRVFTHLDYVDAALCALTGLLALEENFEALGEPGEGFLILPRAT